MIRLPWRDQPLTEEQVRDHFMLVLDDDTEDKPWMVIGDLQFWSASAFAHGLRIYARARGLPWYVASMHPILYSWRGVVGKKQLAPDVYVAFVPDHSRSNYDVDVEGGFPPFVLEVVSPASSQRDRIEKREAYDALGVREYALLTPTADNAATLEGYRRATDGRFVQWEMDEESRLWSEVLGVFLVVQGSGLRAVTTEGEPLLTPEETDAAWRRAERERAAEIRRLEEAEVEVRRLRAELDRRRQE